MLHGYYLITFNSSSVPLSIQLQIQIQTRLSLLIYRLSVNSEMGFINLYSLPFFFDLQGGLKGNEEACHLWIYLLVGTAGCPDSPGRIVFNPELLFKIQSLQHLDKMARNDIGQYQVYKIKHLCSQGVSVLKTSLTFGDLRKIARRLKGSKYA